MKILVVVDMQKDFIDGALGTPEALAIVPAVKALIESYLAEQRDYLRGFAQNYSPEDIKKIDNAAVTVKGCYVIYYILSPEDEARVMDAIEALLVVKQK